MPQFQNSEIVRHILQTIISISSRKTTKGYAVLVMNELIKKLQEKYNFLKLIEIKDMTYIEAGEPITIMSDIDGVKSNDVGKALYDIIKMMNSNLGKEAGYFFIKELRNNIKDDYYSTIEEMGLDLGVMQLELEINEMTKKL